MKTSGLIFTINGAAPDEMGSQVKDLYDACIHRRIEPANQRDGTSKRVDQHTVYDRRQFLVSDLAEAPFQLGQDVITAMLIHTNGDELDN